MSKPTVFPRATTTRTAERQADIAARDELILAAVICFPRDTAAQLAERVGVSVRVLSDRVNRPDMQQRLAELRAISLADAAAVAMGQAVNAVETIRKVMCDADAADRDRLTASRLMIEAAIKLQDAAFIGPQLAMVKTALANIPTLPPGESPPDAGAPAEGIAPTAEAPPAGGEDRYADPGHVCPDVLAKIEGIRNS